MAKLFLGGTVDPATHERTGTDGDHLVELDTDTFTTHGVIVGMTGSGKTGLAVVLLEEALLAGIPALIIDPKGDMGNLDMVDILGFLDLSQIGGEAYRDSANVGLLDLVAARTGLSRQEAYALCSLVGDLRITQVVNGNKGVHVMLEKRYLEPPRT